MTINISKAMSSFDLADFAELNCGSFDIKIRQAAIHNEEFRAAISKRALSAKKKSLVPDKGSLTGSFEEDVALFADTVIIGWGTRPLLEDNGKEVPFSRELIIEIFTGSKQGKVLFGKIQAAAMEDSLFAIGEQDIKN